jgi:hypothetical protein
MPLSPLASSNRGLSILDAPLPASLDSNDISYFARHGPIAASVPSKFGMESPPSSLPPTSDAVKSLYASAYDDSRGKTVSQGHSPPAGSEDSFSGRALHSQRLVRPKVFSSSVPRPTTQMEYWDSGFTFEEDFIPAGLHQELLSPQERSRIASKNDEDTPTSHRISFSGLGTPVESSSKVSSPITSSPSRFSPLFARHRKDEELSSTLSNLGHVGSPLRTTSTQLGSSPNIRTASRPTSGDVSPYFASPPRPSVSISGISQQLQRTRLSRGESSNSEGNLPSYASSKLLGNAASHGLSRALSSSSINNRNVTSIDEEKDEFVFSMDEVDENKRNSGERWAYHLQTSQPNGRKSPSGGVGAIGGERRSGLAHESKVSEPDAIYFGERR